MFKVTGKKNGVKTTKTLTATVTVKPVTITAASEGENLTVGSTASDLFTVKPSGKKLTYTSSNPEVATVDEDGTVTAVAAGEATITASSKYAEESASVTVNVKAAVLESVTQASTTTLAAVFSGDTSAISASDITITNTATSANIAVKDFDSDTNTITTYVAMADGNEYTVTYDDVTVSFIATDGTVAQLAVTPTEITVATEETIYAVLSDANDVVIDKVEYGTTYTNLDFEIAVEDGYTSGSALYLSETGDTATASLTYHSGTFDDDGNEVGNLTQTATITAVDAATVTVSGVSALYSRTDYTNYTTATGETIAAGDTGYAYLQLTFSDDTTSVDFSDYTVESSDDDVAYVSESVVASGEYSLTANKAGTVYLIVEKDGTVIDTVSLTVKSKRTATSLSLSSTSLSLSTSVDSATTVTATVLDQYGDSMAISDFSEDNLTLLNTPADGAELGDVLADEDSTTSDGSINVDVSGLSSMSESSRTYSIKVTYGSLSKTLTVVARVPGDATKYGLELSATSVDAIISVATGTAITAKLYSYDSNGVKVADITDKADKIEFSAADAKGVTSGSSITINVPSTGAKMSAGTYKVTATYTDTDGKVWTYTKSFTVTDSQATATANVDKLTLSNDSDLNSIITVKYDGKTYTDAITGYNGGSETTVSEKVYVDYITVTIQLDTDVVIVQDITIGKTITIS